MVTPAASSTGQDRYPAITLPGIPTTPGTVVDVDTVISQMVRRASTAGFDQWWRRAESVGFCAHPIQLAGVDRFGRAQVVWTRCNNRRAHICPSCSDLYARDTWQLVHAGAAGGRHNVPAGVSVRPQVFLTLTAPSFGPVHGATGTVCREQRHTGQPQRCVHGKPLSCNHIHNHTDPLVGQPLCGPCYDYLSHVLFSWHLPELWRRFTIALRRAVRRELKVLGVDPDLVRVSFVKVVEMQARAVPHIHALIRLDPTNDESTASGEPKSYGRAASGGAESRHLTEPRWQSPITATALAGIVHRAAAGVAITVPDPHRAVAGHTIHTPGDDDTAAAVAVRFGTQIDTQSLTAESSVIHSDSDAGPASGLSARRVARYLAKYVTKSLQDFGIAARRLSTEAIAALDVTEHIRSILFAIAALDHHAAIDAIRESPWTGIGRWLHTLGYRGHITTKSRHYSTTMTALRIHRAEWTRNQNAKTAAAQHDQTDTADQIGWEFDRAGHATTGDRVLAVSASLRHIAARRTGLVEARDQQSDRPRRRDD